MGFDCIKDIAQLLFQNNEYKKTGNQNNTMIINSIPTPEQCYAIIKEHEMFPNIIDHSEQVKNVTEAIIDNLIQAECIDRELALAGALLHDIAKTRTIKTGEMRHDLIGAEIMREYGCESIAQIIESHVVFSGFNPDGQIEEREIVFYADKRVMHDKIVSLDNRVEDLVQRYGKTDYLKSMIIKNREFILKLESKIQNFMTIEIDSALAMI